MLRYAVLLSCLPRPQAGLTTRLLERPRTRRRSHVTLSHDIATTNAFPTAFELPVEDGLCLALSLPSGEGVALPLEELHDLERSRLDHMKPARQISFAGGRVAIRRALTTLCDEGIVGCPVLPDEVGAPVLPEGVLGSISHTRGLVAAVVCVPPEGLAYLSGSGNGPAPAQCAVGVDVEGVGRALSPRAALRCLHEDERLTLDAAPSGLASGEELLLRVSVKEALYKAIHPLVRQTIRWHSVQVLPAADGSCAVRAADLEEQVGTSLQVEASWRVRDGFFVTTARASISS